jgi:hypothetical protein
MMTKDTDIGALRTGESKRVLGTLFYPGTVAQLTVVKYRTTASRYFDNHKAPTKRSQLDERSST